MTEIKNAKVSSTMLGVEDHGILTAYIGLDYGGSGQSFGGYGFDGPVRESGRVVGRESKAFGMEFIRRVLDTLEVDSWEKLKGTPCRVDADFGKVHRIGHFMKDKWFDPSRDLSHLAAR